MNPTQRQRLLMIVTLAAVGLYIADLVFITPMGRAWSERSARIATLQRQVSEGRGVDPARGRTSGSMEPLAHQRPAA